MWPLGPHPANKNEVIVWDLSADPAELGDLDVEAIRLRMFSRADALPEGTTRLPIKTIHINKSPIVIGNLKTLSAGMATHWKLDIAQALRHAESAATHAAAVAGLWPAVFERAPRDEPIDVDEDLYGGFVGNEDRRTLQRLKALAPDALASRHPDFRDPRLAELLFRYPRAQLPDDAFRRRAPAVAGALRASPARRRRRSQTLASFAERIDELGEDADERTQEILGALVDYATAIAPERD